MSCNEPSKNVECKANMTHKGTFSGDLEIYLVALPIT